MFNRITRAFYTSQFRKANAHYQAEKAIGNRDLIQRPGKESVEVILYRPKEIAHMPVFVQIHGGAWVGMDAVDDDEYCARISRELGAFVVNINYQRLYEKPFPYAQGECVDVVKCHQHHRLDIHPAADLPGLLPRPVAECCGVPCGIPRKCGRMSLDSSRRRGDCQGYQREDEDPYQAAVWAQQGLFASGSDFDMTFRLTHPLKRASKSIGRCWLLVKRSGR